MPATSDVIQPHSWPRFVAVFYQLRHECASIINIKSNKILTQAPSMQLLKLLGLTCSLPVTLLFCELSEKDREIGPMASLLGHVATSVAIDPPVQRCAPRRHEAMNMNAAGESCKISKTFLHMNHFYTVYVELIFKKPSFSTDVINYTSQLS